MTTDVARAYDAVADGYDAQLAGDVWIRHWLWRRYARRFEAGMHVIDIGCGSGADAIWLAQRGVCVTGVDPSARMLAVVERKARAVGVEIPTVLGDASVLGDVESNSADGILSAFAALNTVADLHPFAADAARVLRPGGWMVLHLLNRFSLWEWLGLVGSGRWRDARCLGRARSRTFVIGGVPVLHHLRTATEAYDEGFATWFDLRGRHGLGILRPPADVRHVPRTVGNLAGWLEDVLRSRALLRDRGRFFVLELQRRSRAGPPSGAISR